MNRQISRRSVVTSLIGMGLMSADPADAAEEPPANAQESLTRLKEGNLRFVSGQTRHAHESAAWRKQLVGGQKPFATILGCSDSRVPIELVFDQGFGDLFVVRVAGNVIAPDVVGSVEYAAEHLRTSLIVIVGHEGCGAVTAAVKARETPTKELPGVAALMKLIEPGLPKANPADSFDKQVAAAVEANVRWSLKQVALLPEARRAIAEKEVTLVGGVYELSTGRVRFLD